MQMKFDSIQTKCRLQPTLLQFAEETDALRAEMTPKEKRIQRTWDGHRDHKFEGWGHVALKARDAEVCMSAFQTSAG